MMLLLAILITAVIIAGVVFGVRRIQGRGKAGPTAPPTPAAPPAETEAPPATTPAVTTSPAAAATPATPEVKPVYTLTLDNGKIQWSDAFYTVFGYPPTEPANTVEWWVAHIHPGDAMHVNDTMDKLLDRSAGRWTTEYRFRKASGEYLLVRDSCEVQRNSRGEATQLVGTMSTRTELGV